MTPLKILAQAVAAFELEHCQYCVVGGHAASLYRSQERFTKDVDFAVVAEPDTDSLLVAERVIRSIGLNPISAFIPRGPHDPNRKAVCMVTSSPLSNDTKGLIDILLPELPWLRQAVARAQHNTLNFGFAMVPTITPEDLVIAKCYALRNSPDRFQDLDDIKDIFEHRHDLDVDYLRHNLARLKVSIPEVLKKYSPRGLIGG